MTSPRDGAGRRLGLSRARRGRRLQAFAAGFRAALVLPAWIVGFSLLGIGALAHDIGTPFWVAVLSTPLLWAGPAQFVFFVSVAAGTGLLATALAVAISSMRLLPMTIAVLALLGGAERALGMRVLVAHYVAATTWVAGMQVLPRLDARDRLPWFLGFGNACILVSTLVTGLGHILSAGLPVFMAAGFLFLTPLFFSITLIEGARGRADLVAIGLGAGLAPVLGPLVGAEFDLLASGAVGGLVGYALHRAAR